MSESIRTVQDAALSRALVSPGVATDHLAFAGALERTRESDTASEPLSVLLSAVAVRTCLDGGRVECVRPPEAVGAALLVDRFDVSIERAASLAARPADEVAMCLDG